MGDTIPRPGLALSARLALLDGVLLGCFMLSVGLVVGLIQSPASPLAAFMPESAFARRAMIGAAMGLTAFGLITSRLGALSGAHMNPAVTLGYLALGRLPASTAAMYVLAQAGLGTLGCTLAGLLMGPIFTDEPVRYAHTVPGVWGPWAALGAETAMCLVMFSTVLFSSNTARLARHTPKIAGTLVALFITFEAPVSGMSMNPARSLASAVPSGVFSSWWVYLLGPITGMSLAAVIFRRVTSLPRVHCCKLNHEHNETCPFCGCDGPIDFASHTGDSDGLSRAV